MDLTKRYQDEDGNPRNILEMVDLCPEWAANRIQEGEIAASHISALEAKCAELGQRIFELNLQLSKARNEIMFNKQERCD